LNVKYTVISCVPSSTCKMLADHLQLYTLHIFLYPVVIENMWYKCRDGGQVATKLIYSLSSEIYLKITCRREVIFHTSCHKIRFIAASIKQLWLDGLQGYFHAVLCLYCCVTTTTKLSMKHTGLSVFQ